MTKKPKICLVCDVQGWAYDIIAQKVKNELSDIYEIEVDYYDMREEPDNFYEVIERHNDCDLIHFFWRKSLIQMETQSFKDKVTNSGRDLEEYIREKSKKISTSVHDFMFTDEENMKLYRNIFNKYASHYFVCAEGLLDIYRSVEGLRPPEGVVHDICDCKLLVPMCLERFEKTDRPLVVGWVGNSKWNLNGVDLKGFHTILKPVLTELEQEGYQIEENYADRNVRWRTHEEMPEYYSQIDVCVCASTCEGTPLPLLESMSCGVPVIATDVGVVRYALGEKQKEFILGSRENGANDEAIKQKLKEKIIDLYDHREKLKELSEENMRSMQEYDGGKIAKDFANYFEKCLKN